MTTCSEASACVLVLTESNACCSSGKFIAVNGEHQEAARRDHGLTEQQLKQVEQANLTCVDSCEPPPIPRARCQSAKCVVEWVPG